MGNNHLTSDEYIEKLKNVQYTLEIVRDDINRSINRMQRRIETGCVSLERDSRLSALAARDFLILAVSDIYEVVTADVDYF